MKGGVMMHDNLPKPIDTSDVATSVKATPSSVLALPTTYIHAATSDHTRRAYQSDVRQFMAWGGHLPSNTEEVLAYLHAHADNLNHRTLQRRIVALRQWHVTQGFTDPTQHPLVKKTVTGIARTHGKPKAKAPALTLSSIEAMNDCLIAGDTARDVRDRALLLIGFLGAFRRSELVAMTWENISFTEEGVIISIPRSKTDQKGEGKNCALPKVDGPLCPVVALKHWQAYTGETGKVFRRITKTDDVLESGFTGQQVSLIIKRLAKAAALPNADTYSSHSLRGGFATQARREGADVISIMRQGRWKSTKTVMGYIEAGETFIDNAAGVILQKEGNGS